MEQHSRHLKYENVKITDELFGNYIKKVSERSIPYQWKMLNDQLIDAEPTYCIQNFRVAAKEMEGERRGVIFQDTDLYKWLETVAYCLAGRAGTEFESLADEAIDLIERAQEEDGYLNTYFTVNAPEKKWTNLVEGHELYTSGHMIEAAVAYYEVTGKEKLLNVARRNADLICRIFGTEEGQINGYPGHQEIELALIKLYRITGEKRYLETAKYFIYERGKSPNYFEKEIERRGGFEYFPELKNYDLEYSQAHMRPASQKKAVGHAVREMYMCSAMADIALECGDNELLEACKSIWENAVNRRMYITGGIGSSGFRERFTTDYDLPNTTNYSETCASIGLMMFGQRMASVTGEAKYYDIVELALYNTVLAGVNIEGDRYFYVNPLEMVPEFCTEHTYMDHVKAVRQKWFSVACCPTNVARTLASLGQYIYAQDEEALYIHQFISSTARTVIGENELEVEMASGLLQEGRVQIAVKSKKAGKLKIRIPDYASKREVSIDEKAGDACQENGYFVLKLPSGRHDIRIDFGVAPRWISANSKVRNNIGKAVLMKGPLVYCLEEKDNGKLLSEIYIEENAEIKENGYLNEFPGNIPAMKYDGIKIEHKDIGDDPLYGASGYQKKPVTLRAIPYCMWNNRGEGEMLVWQKVRI